HHLAHLLRHHLTEAAAEDGEILREDEDGAAVDRAVAGNDGVAPGPVLLHLDSGLGGRVDRRLAQLAQVGELLVVGFGVSLAHRARKSIYAGFSASPD